MKTALCATFLMLVLAVVSSGQVQPPSSNQAPPTSSSSPSSATETAATTGSQTVPMMMQFSPGTVIRVHLEKTIDAKKAHAGDEVIGKTMDDLKSVPPGLATRGCQIVGHVVEATPHEGGSPSTLRIAFDKMILKNGSSMTLPAFIQAVGYADQYDSSQALERTNQPGGGEGHPGGYMGGQMPSTSSTSNPDAKLPLNATGTIGIPDVELKQGTAQDSILTSKKKNVKLESGMQMILKTI